MTLWTFMPRVALDKLVLRGHLKPDGRRVPKVNRRQSNGRYLSRYAWMEEQYRLRVNAKLRGPLLWAYGTKPDLRRNPYRWSKEPGSILVKFSAPKRIVLLSNYWAWDNVYMTEAFVPHDKAECDNEQCVQRLMFHISEEDHEPFFDFWHTLSQVTWTRIFDIERHSSSDLWSKDFVLQAVLDHLKLDWVQQVTDLDTHRKLGRFGALTFF